MSLVLKNENVKTFEKLLVLIAIGTLAPLIGNIYGQQFVTGPIVNATLFIAITFLKKDEAFFVAIIPSAIALGIGLLPAMLAPMLPFIMLSNILIMLVLNKIRDKNYIFAVLISSLAKFIFLFAISSLILGNFLKGEAAQKVLLMMSWPQLITAIVGGLLAWGIIKIIKRKNKIQPSVN